MIPDVLTLVALGLAAIPATLFLLNLALYRRLPRALPATSCPARPRLSVLIPARNEEANIRATLTAVLASREADFEVVVLDDHSTDATARIVRDLAAGDPRLRLESAPALPPGWCGKQHACHVLARLARHPLLVFLDADVRLAPDALGRMADFMERGRRRPGRPVALASGVPAQDLGTWGERLLIPLIHFVLLGYLPMFLMRLTCWGAASAGCGQLFVSWRDAYERCGGHAMLRDSLHDGVKLPRAFRRAGLGTDLFDATDLATCRMYRSSAETWRGLGKNATEGLAAPGTILPMTLLLLGGQVLPWVLLAAAPWLSAKALGLAGAAAALSWLPRLLGVVLFRQPLGSALLHPMGVLALLVIQWQALARHCLGRPMEWKGRRYAAGTGDAPASGLQAGPAGVPRTRWSVGAWLVAIVLLLACAWLLRAGLLGADAAEPKSAPATPVTRAPDRLALADQYEQPQQLGFPHTNVVVLFLADRKGSDEIDGWVTALKERHGGRVEIRGLADVRGVPGLLRGRVRKKFQEQRKYPVMMDWSGEASAQLGLRPGVANVLVLARDGRIEGRFTGAVRPEILREAITAVDAALARPMPAAGPRDAGGR
ncbi:MAG: hypothetical protein RJA22_730 [Verrucomicrobiota bacterium]|jgi:hypothetical protein